MNGLLFFLRCLAGEEIVEVGLGLRGLVLSGLLPCGFLGCYLIIALLLESGVLRFLGIGHLLAKELVEIVLMTPSLGEKAQLALVYKDAWRQQIDAFAMLDKP